MRCIDKIGLERLKIERPVRARSTRSHMRNSAGGGGGRGKQKWTRREPSGETLSMALDDLALVFSSLRRPETQPDWRGGHVFWDNTGQKRHSLCPTAHHTATYTKARDQHGNVGGTLRGWRGVAHRGGVGRRDRGAIVSHSQASRRLRVQRNGDVGDQAGTGRGKEERRGEQLRGGIAQGPSRMMSRARSQKMGLVRTNYGGG